MLTTQEEIPVTRPTVVPDEPGEHHSYRSPLRRRVTPVLAAGAVLVGLVNAGVFLILDGFAVERGLGLVVEVTLGILAFVTALVLSEAQHRRHSRWTDPPPQLRPREQQFLSTDDIIAIERRFRREHPRIARGQAQLMHWPWPATDEQLRVICEQMRAVTFTPAGRPPLPDAAEVMPMAAAGQLSSQSPNRRATA